MSQRATTRRQLAPNRARKRHTQKRFYDTLVGFEDEDEEEVEIGCGDHEEKLSGLHSIGN